MLTTLPAGSFVVSGSGATAWCRPNAATGHASATQSAANVRIDLLDISNSPLWSRSHGDWIQKTFARPLLRYRLLDHALVAIANTHARPDGSNMVDSLGRLLDRTG